MAKKSTDLERFVQCLAVQISHQDGTKEVVPVPASERENRLANQVMASRMRKLVDDTLTKYREKDMTLTPKEIKDLVEAAKHVADFSGLVYKEAEFGPSDALKAVDKGEAVPDTIDLSKLASRPIETPGKANPAAPRESTT